MSSKRRIPTMPIAIIVYGGGGTGNIEAEQKGCKEAVAIGWRVLQSGGSALEAIEVAIQALEDNPLYDAGRGSHLSRDGKVEMDAGMMEGHTLQVGAVANVELIKNPILLARRVLESPHVLLVGKGAQIFAQEQGIALCKQEDLVTAFEYRRWQAAQQAQVEGKPQESEKSGTVGAVAVDSLGHLAAGSSTGGIPHKYPGRVGDTPLVGCGFYADENTAIACAGYGEGFMRLLIAKRASEFVAGGMNVQEAADAAIRVLETKVSGTGGLIIVDHGGKIGFAYNAKNMPRAYMCEGIGEPIAGA
jgi:L-asparaginase / beta-aspartyl-peptidase